MSQSQAQFALALIGFLLTWFSSMFLWIEHPEGAQRKLMFGLLGLGLVFLSPMLTMLWSAAILGGAP